MDPSAFDALARRSVPHILEKIFLSLDYKSFRSCKKVSNSWNKLLKTESFKRKGKSVFREDIERQLHRASKRGKKKEVRKILSSGMADVNCIGGRHKETPLSYASRKGHKHVVKHLLDRGADPNKANTKGGTPLHRASKNGHKDVVQLLLKRGAEPNKADADGWTPLHWSAYLGDKGVVQILLNGGADPIARNGRGQTPLSLAHKTGQMHITKMLKKYYLI